MLCLCPSPFWPALHTGEVRSAEACLETDRCGSVSGLWLVCDDLQGSLWSGPQSLPAGFCPGRAMVQRPFLPVSGAVPVPGCRGHRNVLLEVEPDTGEGVGLLQEGSERSKETSGRCGWREPASLSRTQTAAVRVPLRSSPGALKMPPPHPAQSQGVPGLHQPLRDGARLFLAGAPPACASVLPPVGLFSPAAPGLGTGSARARALPLGLPGSGVPG